MSSGPDQARRGLLAHVLVNKYADHLPLYRQSRIFDRDGVANGARTGGAPLATLDRSTLADLVGKSTALLAPLADAIGRHVLAGQAIFADGEPLTAVASGSSDQWRNHCRLRGKWRAPVAMLAPGTGKTQTARLWAYGRDER